MCLSSPFIHNSLCLHSSGIIDSEYESFLRHLLRYFISQNLQLTYINNSHNNFTIIMTFDYHHNQYQSLYNNYKTTTKSLNIQSSNYRYYKQSNPIFFQGRLMESWDYLSFCICIYCRVCVAVVVNEYSKELKNNKITILQ